MSVYGIKKMIQDDIERVFEEEFLGSPNIPSTRNLWENQVNKYLGDAYTMNLTEIPSAYVVEDEHDKNRLHIIFRTVLEDKNGKEILLEIQ